MVAVLSLVLDAGGLCPSAKAQPRTKAKATGTRVGVRNCMLGGASSNYSEDRRPESCRLHSRSRFSFVCLSSDNLRPLLGARRLRTLLGIHNLRPLFRADDLDSAFKVSSILNHDGGRAEIANQ